MSKRLNRTLLARLEALETKTKGLLTRQRASGLEKSFSFLTHRECLRMLGIIRGIQAGDIQPEAAQPYWDARLARARGRSSKPMVDDAEPEVCDCPTQAPRYSDPTESRVYNLVHQGVLRRTWCCCGCELYLHVPATDPDPNGRM